MNDHANKDFLVKKPSKREQLKATEDHNKRITAKRNSLTGRICAYISNLPFCNFVRKYRRYRQVKPPYTEPRFTRRAAFWLSWNGLS